VIVASKIIEIDVLEKRKEEEKLIIESRVGGTKSKKE
jgi:hypothetical protein